ncbi:MAG: SDR family NAD(P)-dependent oxidoreductase [Pseudomonadota bacterium]
MRLSGKTVLVTGGASGLGKAIATEFVREGAAVAIADINFGDAEALSRELRENNGNAIAIEIDVRDPVQIRAAVGMASDRLGSIDILVNSAGIARLKPFLDMSIEDFDLVHEVNLRGTFIVGQEVARRMVGRGGSIINISSASGRRGSYGRTAYGPGKAGVILLTEIMAVELAEHGIRVNALAPGPIETPIVAAQLTEAGRLNWTAVVPMARFGRPDEVARAALFLACEDSSFITGHTLDVDGGYCAGGILKP